MMKVLVAGVVVVAGILWLPSCATLDRPAGATKPPASRGIPGVMHKGGMLDDELNYGRTYQ